MQAIQISSQVDSFKELGRVYLIIGNIPKAAETYRKAVKLIFLFKNMVSYFLYNRLNPEDSELLASLGILYLQVKNKFK